MTTEGMSQGGLADAIGSVSGLADADGTRAGARAPSEAVAVMYDGALRGWWFGVVVIALFVVCAIAWKARGK
ncbi:hypothetical protein [Streptomyces sp. SID10815]|uniref:hypothetical protein n=1 Tax=Streptomyces sp. SID10815 TaxID=2706027 RepID=UPI0013C8F6EB|nr:hypothetical protein [Streptomyces sp. SID10815]NEA50555.1 hypothetical protein [Streptomyces sp. SID10815]